MAFSVLWTLSVPPSGFSAQHAAHRLPSLDVSTSSAVKWGQCWVSGLRECQLLSSSSSFTNVTRGGGLPLPSTFSPAPRPVSHLSYFFPLWDWAAQHRSDRTKPNLSFRTGPWAWSFHQPLKLEAAVGLLKRSSFPVLRAPPWSYFT